MVTLGLKKCEKGWKVGWVTSTGKFLWWNVKPTKEEALETLTEVYKELGKIHAPFVEVKGD